MVQDQQINEEILNKIPFCLTSPQVPFSKKEFISLIVKYNNSLAPGLGKLSWSYLKHILKNKSYLKEIINITNACFKLGHWPAHFKMLTTIVILKPNKALYNSPKLFRLIVLLNTLGKLIEKVTGERLQFYVLSSNIIHWSQPGSLKFRATSDTGIVLTHFIHMEQIRNLSTSTLAFDISQFFSSLNHHLLPCILGQAGFDPKAVCFFQNYLISRKTYYVWNSFSSHLFNVDIGVRQGSTLSPILSALYLAPILYILKNHLKILKILVSILSFVDDSLLITQSKSLSISNSLLFCSYNITSNLLTKFGLIIGQSKTEMFYFSRLFGAFNHSLLDLSTLGGLILYPKETWQYLEFIFNRKLFFHQYIDFYTNKVILTVKYMKILSNSVQGLIPHQKYLLYRSCVLPIMLYDF